MKNLHEFSSRRTPKPSNLKRLQAAMQSRELMLDPFLSTSADPVQSAKYALGTKITDDKDQLTSGIVGRLCIYLMSKLDFEQKYDSAMDIERLTTKGKIGFNSRLGREREITFVGGIHHEDYVAHLDAKGSDSAEELGYKAAVKAKDKAGQYNAKVVESTSLSRERIMSSTKLCL